MASGINVQVTINAADQGAAAQLLALKKAAAELGVQFTASTKAAEQSAAGMGSAFRTLHGHASEFGRTASGSFAGAIEGATGLRTVLAQVALGYEAVHAARAFLEKGFGATSAIEQAGLGIGAEIAGNATLTGPGGAAIEGAEKLALATAEGRHQMELLAEESKRVGIEATKLAEIFTGAVAPALRGGGNLADLRTETVQLAALGRTLGIPYEAVATILRQILNGHVQQRSALVAVLGISNEELKTAKERGTIQDLLNSKLKAYAGLAEEADTTLRGIGARLRTSIEATAVSVVEPIVQVIEQQIGPALRTIDLSGLTAAFRGVATQAAVLLGKAFDGAVAGAQAFQRWLEENRTTVQETLASLGQVARAVGELALAAAKLALAFVQVGLTSGVIAGAVRTVAALFAEAVKLAPVLATLWVANKVSGYIVALNAMSTAFVGLVSRIGPAIAGLNASGVAAGLMASGMGAAEAAAAGAAAPITAAGVAAGTAAAPMAAFGSAAALAAPLLTALAVALGVAVIAYQAYRAHVEAARAAEQARVEALGRALAQGPALISQLRDEEEALRQTTAGSEARKEQEERVHGIKQQLIALSPAYTTALANETQGMEGQAAALAKVTAELEKQARAKVAAAEARVGETQAKLDRAQAESPVLGGVAGGLLTAGGPIGAAAVGAAAAAQRVEIASLRRDHDEAVKDLAAAQKELAPEVATPAGAGADARVAAREARRRQETEQIREELRRRVIDRKTYNEELKRADYDAAADEIKIRQEQLTAEPDPFRKAQIQKQIDALEERKVKDITVKGVPPETPEDTKGAKSLAAARIAAIKEEATEEGAAAERQYKKEEATAGTHYEQLIEATRRYYTTRANIEYTALQKEIDIQESLLAKETKTDERAVLVVEIERLERRQAAITAKYSDEQILKLDELKKKREEAARVSISERQTDVRETLTARVEDIKTQVDVGSLTKAQGAEQLAVAYKDALAQLRELYLEAQEFAATTSDPKAQLQVARIRTEYNQLRLELVKATETANEFARSIGEAAGHVVNQVPEALDNIFRARGHFARLEAYRAAALNVIKDLQRAVSEPISKIVQQTVTRKVSQVLGGKSEAEKLAAAAPPLDLAGGKLSNAAAALLTAATALSTVAIRPAAAGGIPAILQGAQTAPAVAQPGATVAQGAVLAPLPVPAAPPLAGLVPTAVASAPGAITPAATAAPGVIEPGAAGAVTVLPPLPTPATPAVAATLATVAPPAPALGGGGAPAAGTVATSVATGGPTVVVVTPPPATPAPPPAGGTATTVAAAEPGGLSPLTQESTSEGTPFDEVRRPAPPVFSEKPPGSTTAAGTSTGPLTAAGAALQTAAGALHGSAGALTGAAGSLLRSLAGLFSGGGGGGGGAASGAAGIIGTLASTVGFARGGWVDRAVAHERPAWFPAAARAFASGGPIHGPGTGTSDSVPAWLSHGEYVHTAATVDHYGVPAMHAVNERQAVILPTYHVRTPIAVAAHPSAARHMSAGGLVSSAPGGGARGGEHHTVNISLEPGLVAKHLESTEGSRAIVRVVSTRRNEVNAALGPNR